MKILGLNKNIHNVWVVYILGEKKDKYFCGAYRTEEKAKEVAEKNNGKYFYKD
jgi:hypothetical protein